ncbi:D-amino acid aminotransferase [Acuticoccus sediminis]|uniref:Probable branched-chain-amino-acid aminotransferase n=1 Tax=Acuticoccus sediminis TaxID=2184697 RepID=A0A8B2NW64_9HYPH|nr:D-amino-acid transaminase [Acuticoccus sediminis]RAI00591.1 D-amino acid aminotransferase [Acuticoccus sediminis]
MSRIAYVNGRYVPHGEACVHVEDRGFQFADGVYEVCEIWDGYIVDMTRHLDRLARSLNELQMDWPVERRAMESILRETARRNRVKKGLVYLQVTRGVARRDFAFPKTPIPATLVVTARSVPPGNAVKIGEEGIAVVTTPDIRWERVDIKTVALLPQVLAKQKAVRAGAKEAWMYDKDGFITEGASSNAWIVNQDGTLVTRPAERGILRGITRAAIMDFAAAHDIKVEERPFTIDEAKAAREAFITSATMTATPVVKIDETPIGNGAPGSVVSELRARFHEGVEKLPLSVY